MTKMESELLTALVELRKQLNAHYRMNVRKDFSLMVADAQASKLIAKYTRENRFVEDNLDWLVK